VYEQLLPNLLIGGYQVHPKFRFYENAIPPFILVRRWAYCEDFLLRFTLMHNTMYAWGSIQSTGDFGG
jgi:hypothetical protein